MTVNEIVSILAIGLTAGFLSGSLGIGGAIVVVPSLVFFYGSYHASGTGNKFSTNDNSCYVCCCI